MTLSFLTLQAIKEAEADIPMEKPPMYILEQSDQDPEYVEYIQEEDMTDNA